MGEENSGDMSEETKPEVVPAQIGRHHSGTIPRVVHMAAYEVYCEVFRPQPALIEGWCRGGFGGGELLGFLYARSFPKKEWRQRFDEALKGYREEK